MKEKKSVDCSGLFETALLYVNMKKYKNIACTDFVNVSIALNSIPMKKTRVLYKIS